MANKIVKKKNLTTIMVTHNLNHAIKYGNRLIAMKDGKVKLDRCDTQKKETTSEEILSIFN